MKNDHFIRAVASIISTILVSLGIWAVILLFDVSSRVLVIEDQLAQLRHHEFPKQLQDLRDRLPGALPPEWFENRVTGLETRLRILEFRIRALNEKWKKMNPGVANETALPLLPELEDLD